MTEKICSEGRDHGYSCCPEHGTHKMRSLGGHTHGCPERTSMHDTQCPVMEIGCHSVGGYSMHHDRGRAGDCRCGVKCQCALINRVRTEEREKKMAAADIAFLDAVQAREEVLQLRQDLMLSCADVAALRDQLAEVRNQIADEIMAAHGGVMCYHAPAADVSYRVCTHLEDASIARNEKKL